MENSIEIKNLTKKYESFSLKDVSFNVPKGTVVGFVGENGAGKSTTLKAILGITRPDSGTITVLGEDSTALSPELKEKIGVVFDTITFPSELTVKKLEKVFSGIYKSWNKEKFMEYMTRFELPLNKKIKSFSRGMEMRLSIAAALSHNPEILILDEPTGGLDPIMRSEILDIFLEFMQDENHTILMSTHITSDLDHIADYICFIHKGQVVFFEERNEMLQKYRILKCTEEELPEIEKSDIIGMRKGRFCNEVLVSCGNKYQDLTSDSPSIEEIMVYYVKDNA